MPPESPSDDRERADVTGAWMREDAISGRWKVLLGGVVVVGGGALALLWRSPAVAPAAGHRPLHIGCPPGSHGKPRYSGAGEALQRARSGEAAAADGDLSSRSLTAGHPSAGGRETTR